MDEAGPEELRARAKRYRRLKRDIADPRTLQALNDLAEECEAKADEAETRVGTQPENDKPS